MHWEEKLDKYRLRCDLIEMGKDLTLAVYGGDTPHVGSVVMSIARPSLTGKGISVTTSVLNGLGHKDELIGRLFAESAAKKKNCTVVCACGIHIDNITSKQLSQIQEASQKLLNKVLETID